MSPKNDETNGALAVKGNPLPAKLRAGQFMRQFCLLRRSMNLTKTSWKATTSKRHKSVLRKRRQTPSQTQLLWIKRSTSCWKRKLSCFLMNPRPLIPTDDTTADVVLEVHEFTTGLSPKHLRKCLTRCCWSPLYVTSHRREVVRSAPISSASKLLPSARQE